MVWYFPGFVSSEDFCTFSFKFLEWWPGLSVQAKRTVCRLLSVRNLLHLMIVFYILQLLAFIRFLRLRIEKQKKKTNRDHILTWWPTDKSRPTIEVYDGDDRNDRILFRHVWVLAGLGRNRKESRRGKNLCLIHDWSLVSRGFLPQNKIKSKKLFTKFKIEKRRRIVFKRLFLFIWKIAPAAQMEARVDRLRSLVGDQSYYSYPFLPYQYNIHTIEIDT